MGTPFRQFWNLAKDTRDMKLKGVYVICRITTSSFMTKLFLAGLLNEYNRTQLEIVTANIHDHVPHVNASKILGIFILCRTLMWDKTNKMLVLFLCRINVGQNKTCSTNLCLLDSCTHVIDSEL